MPQKKPLLLLGILLLACQAQTSELTHTPIPTLSPSLPSPTPPFADDLIQLANEYKALRDIPGQFGGGEWVAEVDQWQGSKHQAMLTLGEQLGDGEYGRSQLTTLLGPADHVVSGGDALFELIQSLPEYETFAQSDEFLVYEWRGTHDFLFFAIQQERIIGSGWWHAGE
jgi:hypothetical protein